MSRFAIDPKWLIYLPPTMSPSETTAKEGYLEYPTEGFHYFRKNGVAKVICEQKHMGSRAVVVVCKDENVSSKRFGVIRKSVGTIYTRTGRKFFDDDALESELLHRIRKAMDQSGFWDEFKTEWACLDCELMPWSAKAKELLKSQYAAVGTAATHALSESIKMLEKTSHRKDITKQPQRTKTDSSYDVDVNFLLEKIMKNQTAATQWWEQLTEKGGEGMVMKPFDFVAKGSKGLIQPALKCRGKEYLRIIYGPEYSIDENLERLKARGLTTKRSLALREFALGIEGLERFVRKEPLRRVHECVFGVLALESEPVDPRL
jgi:protein phosphatase